MNLILVDKIYQRATLVDSQPADAAGGSNPQLLHNGCRPDRADPWNRLQEFGHPHPRYRVVCRSGPENVRHGELSGLQPHFGCCTD